MTPDKRTNADIPGRSATPRIKILEYREYLRPVCTSERASEHRARPDGWMDREGKELNGLEWNELTEGR